MPYKDSDIILCFPGIGRTFFAGDKTTLEIGTLRHSQFTLDKDFSGGMKAFVDELVKIKKSRQYRYILVQNNLALHLDLIANDVTFLVVAPNPNHKQIWMKRWMQAGASAELIDSRLARWEEIGTRYSGEIEAIYLGPDEWLGNILQKTPLTEADAKDA